MNGSVLDPVTDKNNYDKYCKPEYFCDHKDTMTYSIDEGNTRSLENWITEFDLTCATHFQISLFGILYWSGFCIGSFIVSKA